MKTIEEIYEEMRGLYAEKTGVSLQEGGDMTVRLLAAAAQIQSLYIYQDWIRRQCFPQTAEEEALDHHADMRGLSRIPARKAQGKISFMLPQPLEHNSVIAAGTVCMTAGLQSFRTTEEGLIPAGELSCTVSAEAEQAGAAGNAAAGSIDRMSIAPTGISACRNPEEFSGGRDRETDAQLRQRILDSYASLPNGTNAAFYESEVLQFPGVAAALVKPRARGIGTVEVCVSALEGLPSETLLEEIRSHLEKLREICVDITVTAPEPVEVDITLRLKVGEEENFSDVAKNVRAKLEAWFDGRRFGKSVLLAELGQLIYGTEGVKNYAISLPAADVEIGEGELPVLRTLQIEEWS